MSGNTISAKSSITTSHESAGISIVPDEDSDGNSGSATTPAISGQCMAEYRAWQPNFIPSGIPGCNPKSAMY
jgi:hypothetical protein